MPPKLKTPYKSALHSQDRVVRKEVRLGDLIEWMRAPNLILSLPERDKDGKPLEEVLNGYGRDACRGYDMDYVSSEHKRDRVKRAEKLAKLESLKPDLNFPFVGAADSRNPMISKTVIQHFTRELSMFLKDGAIAKFIVTGRDEDGQKAAKAERCSAFLSYYMLNVMDGWIETHMNALMAKPLAGVVFKKTYYDLAKGKVVTNLMRSNDYVVDYFTRSLKETCRGTNTYTLYHHEIEAKIRSGYFVEFEYGLGDAKKDEESGSGVNAEAGGLGLEDDDNIPHIFLEQSTRLDLDGDGFAEPYVLIVHQQTETVVQIFADFDPETVFIRVAPLVDEDEDAPVTEFRTISLKDHFTELTEQGVKISKKATVFVADIEKLQSVTRMLHLPAVDGGFYGMGAEILSDITELINDVTNRLLDAGTIANTKGGFISDEIELIDGDEDSKVEYVINEFKRVKLNGKSIHDHIFEFAKTEASVVLYNLRNDLIREGNEESGATNLMSGELPKGDAPVGTVLALLEQGLQKFSAIMILAYMGVQDELRIIWSLLKKHPPKDAGYPGAENGWSAMVEGDFDDDGMIDVVPIADRQSITAAHKLMKAQALFSILGQVVGHGGVGQEIIRRYLEALAIPEIDAILPRDAQAPESPDMIKLKQEEDKISLEGEKAMMEHENRQLELSIAQMRGETDMFAAGSKMKVDEARSLELIASAESKEPGNQQYMEQFKSLSKVNEIARKMLNVKNQQVKTLEKEMAALRAQGGQNPNANGGTASISGRTGSDGSPNATEQPGRMAAQPGN